MTEGRVVELDTILLNTRQIIDQIHKETLEQRNCLERRKLEQV